MSRPVTDDLIKRLARACAYDAALQGATAPWGDGDIPDGGLLAELLGRKPTREDTLVFEREFRAGILDYAGQS